MQYKASTPPAYLKALDSDWRKETLKSLRSIILEESSEIKEFMNYKMLAYGTEENIVFHLNAQKIM